MGFVADFIGGDILGLGGGESAAQDTYKQAYNLFRDLQAPDAESLLKRIRDVQYMGDIKPEQQRVFEQAASEMGKISEDPRLRDAQMRALSQLQNIGTQGGLTATDRARLADIQRQQAGVERGNREAILQNMAARGMGGSGFELAAQLANQQEAADRAAQSGTDVAAQAEQRALAAIQGAGQMGGQIRGQEWQQQAERAAAQDAINRFNAANRQQVESGNVGARNAALQRNADLRQQLAGQNTMYRNQAMMDLVQQQYQNELNKRMGMSGQLGNIAGSQQAAGASRDKFLGGLIGSGAKAFGFGAPSFV